MQGEVGIKSEVEGGRMQCFRSRAEECKASIRTISPQPPMSSKPQQRSEQLVLAKAEIEVEGRRMQDFDTNNIFAAVDVAEAVIWIEIVRVREGEIRIETEVEVGRWQCFDANNTSAGIIYPLHQPRAAGPWSTPRLTNEACTVGSDPPQGQPEQRLRSCRRRRSRKID